MLRMEGENIIFKRFNLKLVKLGLSVGETWTNMTDFSSILNNQDYGKKPNHHFACQKRPQRAWTVISTIC